MLHRTQYFVYDLNQGQAFWRKALGQSGLYQPENLAIALKHVRKRGLAVDVGAHFGMNSMAYSRLFERVVAFEPQRALFRQAKKHLRLNGIENVELHDCALGSRRARMKIGLPPGTNDGQARLVSSSLDLPEVPVQTLDSFGLEPDFLKIDVEGFETNVLKGGRRTLERSRPVVLVETNDNVEWEQGRSKGRYRVATRCGDIDVFKLLRASGYRAFIPGPTLVEMGTAREFRCRSFDTLFVPRGSPVPLPIRRLTAEEIRIGRAPKR